MEQAPQRTQGRRLRALGKQFHQTVSYALRGLDRETFGAYFPGLYPELVDALYGGYRQALHHARCCIEAEFDQLCEENGLRDKLLSLEQMCEEQGINDGDATEPAARQPTGGGPAAAARLCLLRAKQAEAAQLRGILQAVQAKRAELEAQLAGRQAAAADLAARLQPLAARLDDVHASAKAWASRTVQPVA